MPQGERDNSMVQQMLKQQALQKQKTAQAAALTQQGQAGVQQQRDNLATRVTDIRSQNENAKQVAVNTLMQQMKLRGEAAQRALANEPKAPTITPNAAPLKQITGVSLTPELSGSNAADSAFFLSPEASQAQFAVGAPVGGGGIGKRQRGTTERIVSEPDNLNSSRKGKF